MAPSVRALVPAPAAVRATTRAFLVGVAKRITLAEQRSVRGSVVGSATPIGTKACLWGHR
eukprot:m.179343 g.179343  ORF g.179343 m.179343 type:complete len:60 (+) comp18389_c0_seq16:1343-1522(+)